MKAAVGDAGCSIDAIGLEPSSDPAFQVGVSFTTPLTLQPGRAVSATVSFFVATAALPLERTGAVNVRTSATQTLPVALSARLSACLLSASPSPLDFGNVGLNLSRSARVTLRNEGNETCEVSGLALEAGSDVNFVLPPIQPRALTVAPGASVPVEVVFTARSSAPPYLKTGALTFRSNDERGLDRVPLSAFVNTICTEAGQYIYTVDSNGQFSRFDPQTLTYVDIAPLICPTRASPFSMNVDQNAVAWVIYSDGLLFSVDTATGVCRVAAYPPNQSGFNTFGMGSVFDSATGLDTLYLSAFAPSSTAPTSPLGRLDFPSLIVTPLGSIDLSSAELAGTGDGQLWAFSPAGRSGAGSNAAVLMRITTTTGATLERYELPTVTTSGGFAVKFFGGAFYIFIAGDVWRVDRMSLNPMFTQPRTPPVRVLQSPGRNIVGAGVSTCAPVQ